MGNTTTGRSYTTLNCLPTFWADVANGAYDEDGTLPSSQSYKGIKSMMRMITQQVGQRIHHLA